MRNLRLMTSLKSLSLSLALVLADPLTACSSSHPGSAAASPSSTTFSAPSGIQLADGGMLGTARFPGGDTPSGGHGQPVGGIGCQAMEGAVLHIHAHLALFVAGKQLAIPPHIGIIGRCLYWVHTHDAEGIIHMESPKYRAFTLGDFFHIWGQPLGTNTVATFKGPVSIYVNGAGYKGDPNAIPLSTHQQIVLELGKRVAPPNYIFPSGD